MKLTHKRINVLCIEIDGYVLPVGELVTIFQFNRHSSFNFYYYEIKLKDYLLNMNIIKFKGEKNGKISYVFSDYDKLLSLKNLILDMFYLQKEELNRDFKLCNLNLDET